MTSTGARSTRQLNALEPDDMRLAAHLWRTHTTRAGLQREFALSRTALGAKLDRLFASGLVKESERAEQSGGRPARLLELNAGYGLVAAVDIGERHSQVVLCSMEPAVVARRPVTLQLDAGPETILDAIADIIAEMLSELGPDSPELLTVGLALPAPVDFLGGIVTGYSVLRGWDGFDIQSWLWQRLGVPVLVENDVNAMAVAEKTQIWPEADSLFYVKVGTGIGSSIFTNGSLYHGAQGAAGDIGHIQLAGHGETLCRCGNRGCVEALTAGWAIVRDLSEEGATDTEAIVQLANAGNPLVLAALREGGRLVGEAVAYATSLLNPQVIVVGGSLAAAGGLMLTGVRQMVYDRVLPLATRRLHLVPARVGSDAAALGAARLAVAAWLEQEPAQTSTAATA